MISLSTTENLMILGWRELVLFSDISNTVLRAKVDTGARTSSLHVERQWRTIERGAPFVAFDIKPKRSSDLVVHGLLPFLDERMVSDSGGHKLLRPFVSAAVEFGGVSRLIEINLADRKNMLFSMLLGRSALSGFLVDGDRSFLHKATTRDQK